MTPIRVLVADDSPVFAEMIRNIIDGEPDMNVIGMAENGEEAIERVLELRPDIVVMDVDMPVMDGLRATTQIMAELPTPILVATADPFRNGVDLSFQALSMGALDLIGKPTSFPWENDEKREFLNKIRILAQIPVVRHQRGSLRRAVMTPIHRAIEPVPKSIVGVVASTGGPSAVAKLLRTLPEPFDAPIVVVQHISDGFIEHLAAWLDSNCDVSVSIAESGETVQPGKVYLSPGGAHTTISSERVVRLDQSKPVRGHQPSGDLLLDSLARGFGSHAVGVIMSGMGDDGARGLTSIFRSGGTTIVQDRESSVVYGMPQTAIDLGVVKQIESLDTISRSLALAIRTTE